MIAGTAALRQSLELSFVFTAVPCIKDPEQLSKQDMQGPLCICWNFRVVSRVPLASTFQLLDETRVEFMKALEGRTIVDVNLAICLVKNPSLDVTPRILIYILLKYVRAMTEPMIAGCHGPLIRKLRQNRCFNGQFQIVDKFCWHCPFLCQ